MRLPGILSSCTLRPGADPTTLEDAERRLGRALPEEYRALLLETDGVEGFIGEHAYLMLFSVADMLPYNLEGGVAELLPGTVFIGSDGGGTAYGFRGEGERLEYLDVPWIGMEPDTVTVLGRSLVEMLENVVRRSWRELHG